MFSFLKKALGTETEVNATSSADDKAKTDVKTSTTAVESDSKLLVNKIPTGINAKESTTVHGLSTTVGVSSTPSPDAEDIDIPESEILKSALSGVPSDSTLQGDAGAASKSGIVNNLTDVRHEVLTQTAKDEIKLPEDLKQMVMNEVPMVNSDNVNSIEKVVPVTVPFHSDVTKSVPTAANTEIHTSSTAPVLDPQTPTKDNGRSATPTKGLSNEYSAAADDEDELQEDQWKTVTSPSKGLHATEKPNRAEQVIDTVKAATTTTAFEGINSTGNTSKPAMTTEAVNFEKSENSPSNIIAVEPVKVTSNDEDQSPAALHSASSIIDLPKVADTAPTISKESPLVTVSTPAYTSSQDVSHSSSSTSTTTVVDTMKVSKGEEIKKESPLVTVSTPAHTSAQDVSHSSSSTSTTTVVDTKISTSPTDIKKDITNESSVSVSQTAVKDEVEAATLASSGDKIAGIPSIALPSALNSVSVDSKNILPDAAVAVAVASKVGVKDEVEDKDQLTAKKNGTEVIKMEKKNDADNDTDVKSADDEVRILSSESNGENVIISEIKSDAALQVIAKSDEDDNVTVPTLTAGVISEAMKKEEVKEEVEEGEEEIKKMEQVKEEKEEEAKKEEKVTEEEEVKEEEIKEKGDELQGGKEEKEKSVESKDVAVKSTEKEIIIIDDSDDDNNETVKKVTEKVVIVIDDSDDDDDDDEPVVAKSAAPRVVYTIDDDDDDDDDDGNVQTQSSRSGSRPYRPASASAAAKKGSSKVKSKECPGLEAWETCINELDELEVIAREMQRDREEEGEDDEEEVEDGEGEDGEDGEEDRWSDDNEELNGTADGNDDYDVNDDDDGDDMVQATAGDDQKDFGVDDEIAGVFLSDDEGEEEDNSGGGDRGGSSYRNDNGSNEKFPSSPPGLHTGNPRGTVHYNGSCHEYFFSSIISLLYSL
jgi:hypothetical protein